MVDGGKQLTTTSGRDTTLQGADASAESVEVAAGRDLTVASVQDTSSGSSRSSGFSLSANVSASTDSPGAPPTTSKGGSGGISGSSGSSDSAVVTDQSTLLAKGGTLDVKVGDTTALKGGVVAALDASGKDSGKLALDTGRLIISDIQDSATSQNVALGLSADINSATKRGEAAKGNLPTLDGSYQSATFAQATKGTVGTGDVTVRDAAGSTDLATVKRKTAAGNQATIDQTTGVKVLAGAAIAKAAAVVGRIYRSHPVSLRSLNYITSLTSMGPDPNITVAL